MPTASVFLVHKAVTAQQEERAASLDVPAGAKPATACCATQSGMQHGFFMSSSAVGPRSQQHLVPVTRTLRSQSPLNGSSSAGVPVGLQGSVVGSPLRLSSGVCPASPAKAAGLLR